MASECIFCGVEEKLTKEHVWPKWLGTALARSPSSQHVFAEDGRTTREYSAPDLTLQARVVCASCNGGWMSRMESSAKALLTPMIAIGQPTALEPDDQRLVTAWATKTAMTMEMAQTADRAIPLAHRRHLWESKTAPGRVQAWLGARSSGHSLVRYDYQRTGETSASDGYGVMLAVGGLFVYLLSLPMSAGGDLTANVGVRLDPRGTLSDKLVRLTPPRRGAVVFPPPRALDDAELDEFFAGLTGH